MTSPPPQSAAAPRAGWRALPGGIWAMGLASMFMDASSEAIHSVLPLYMAAVLGASMVTIGLLEGIAEATAAATKVFSGALSDRLRRRKGLMVFGYALAACTKPVFPLAGSVGWVFAARFVDRIGKGIRGAPRDALIADLTPAQLRGAAYGLRQALDSVGACLGPLLAVAVLAASADDTRAVMWAAVVPAFVAVALLVGWVREPAQPGGPAEAAPPRPALADARRLPPRYWGVVALGAVFTLARFSEAFLVLRGQQAGLALQWVPAVMVVMSACYALVAYPAGAAADRIAARTLLLAGLALLIAADLVLALAQSVATVFAGAALWGLHMAFTQGLLSKLVADAAPAALRGTAFGVFNLVSGGALLAASVIAGALWDQFGPRATFVAGAAFAAVAVLGLLAWPMRPRAIHHDGAAP
jgi:MFS family permease